MFDYVGGKAEFKLFGADKDALGLAVARLKEKYDGIKAAFKTVYGDTLFVIDGKDIPAEKLDSATKAFIKNFGTYIYAEGNVDLAAYAVDLLKIGKRKLCVAESFTGGRLAHSIVSIPGASEVFYSGLVCYDTDAKIRYLGVSEETVRLKTVVSRDVAFEMVRGLLSNGTCDVALSTTGYASPTGDPERPGGLCFIGAGEEDKVEVNGYRFKGGRPDVIEQGKNAALFMLCKTLRGGLTYNRV